MELKYHKSCFVEYALTEREPESTLESLIAKHDEVCTMFKAWEQQQKLEEDKWRKIVINQDGIEKSVIDLDAWEREDEESYTRYATSAFNVLELIDWLEKKIDIKICYMNSRDVPIRFV